MIPCLPEPLSNSVSPEANSLDSPPCYVRKPFLPFYPTTSLGTRQSQGPPDAAISAASLYRICRAFRRRKFRSRSSKLLRASAQSAQRPHHLHLSWPPLDSASWVLDLPRADATSTSTSKLTIRKRSSLISDVAWLASPVVGV